METNIKEIEEKLQCVLSTYEELVEAEIESSEQNVDELNVNIKFKPKATIKKVEVKFEKPEGMSDTQFKTMMNRLQEEIEKQNMHEYELTN